jgi:hypothetical protein
MSKLEMLPCMKCHQPTHIDLIDGKDDGTGNFNILECWECYGPDWRPLSLGQEKPNSKEMRATMEARRKAKAS